jgi:hypothetical protein
MFESTREVHLGPRFEGSNPLQLLLRYDFTHMGMWTEKHLPPSNK